MCSACHVCAAVRSSARAAGASPVASSTVPLACAAAARNTADDDRAAIADNLSAAAPAAAKSACGTQYFDCAGQQGRSRTCRAALVEGPPDHRCGGLAVATREHQESQTRASDRSCAGWPGGSRVRRARNRRAADASRPLGSSAKPTAGCGGLASARLAFCALTIAATQSPLACSSCDLCTRHCPRNGTMSDRESHHAASAFVHSEARRRSNRSMHARITPQYTMPVVIGLSSSAVTDTIDIVEPGNAGIRLTLRDERLTVRERAERTEIHVAQSIADLGGAYRHRGRLRSVTAVDFDETPGNEDVARGRTFRDVLRDQGLRTGQPTVGLRPLTTHQQAQPEPERVAGRLTQISCRVRGLGARPPTACRIRRPRRADRPGSQPVRSPPHRPPTS